MSFLNEKIMVISNDGTKDIFKPRLIGQFIKEKTGVNDEIVKKNTKSYCF